MGVHPLDRHGESGVNPALTPITPRRSSRRPKVVRRLESTVTGMDSDVFGSDERDTADPDYTPVSNKSRSQMPDYKTPNNRVSGRNYYPLPDAVKKHVADASHLGGRCVIEWCIPESGVDYCHVITLATTGDVVRFHSAICFLYLSFPSAR